MGFDTIKINLVGSYFTSIVALLMVLIDAKTIMAIIVEITTVMFKISVIDILAATTIGIASLDLIALITKMAVITVSAISAAMQITAVMAIMALSPIMTIMALLDRMALMTILNMKASTSMSRKVGR